MHLAIHQTTVMAEYLRQIQTLKSSPTRMLKVANIWSTTEIHTVLRNVSITLAGYGKSDILKVAFDTEKI